MKHKSQKQLDASDDIHFDGHYGAEDAMDQGPVAPGSENYQEHFDGGKTRHKGGVHGGYRDTGMADNHTGDFIGDHNADDQSLRGAQSLDHLLGIAKPKDPDEHRYALPEHTAHEMDEREDDEPLEADLPVKRRGRR